MKKIKLNLFLLVTTVITLLSTPSCNRIDAGHVGIKVNLYGTNKGVSDITEVTGMVWYNPFTKSVYEVPTFVQNAIYTHKDERGSSSNEEFRVTTRDGMTAAFDVSMNYFTPSENVTDIFRKYRKPIEDLEKTVIRTYLREAFNNVATKYTAEGLYENRAAFEEASEQRAKDILKKEGFIVEQIVILNEIRLPKDVTQRINDKVKAAQITKQKQEEVLQERAEAEKKIARAQGKAESMRIEAEAEAYAYKTKKQELTSLLLEQMYIEKWNGNYGTGNVFGGSAMLYKQLK
jgi:regulator of protease activity HflC (stomatin/prohibitin superfamily)